MQGKVPHTDDLELGELALNTYDGKLFAEVNTGVSTVVEIGSNLSQLSVSGVVTATSFDGDGSSLTGIAVTTLTFSNSSVSIATTDGAINFTANDVLVASMSSERVHYYVPIDMHDNRIINLAAPSSLSDAANKDYVDNQVAGEFPTGDYGDLSSATTDPFGQPISDFTSFDCLTTPSGSLATVDLELP